MNPKRKKNWMMRILVFFAVLVIIIVFLLPSLSTGRGHRLPPHFHCIYDLKQIGLSLKQYAMDYEDFFPPENNALGLDKLRELDYLTDYTVYACHDSKTKIGSKGPLKEKNCSYIYLGGFKEFHNPKIPLAFDKPGNHTDFMSVLFLDGSAKRYSTPAAGSCEDIIIFLNKEHKYPDKLFKQLLSKSKKIDSNLHFY